jgi:hypothetical protein
MGAIVGSLGLILVAALAEDPNLFDDSSESYAIQLSVPVRGEGGPIGALTLTLRVSAAGMPVGENGTR